MEAFTKVLDALLKSIVVKFVQPMFVDKTKSELLNPCKDIFFENLEVI